MEVLSKLPCAYVAIGLLWSGYQGVRGIVETRLANTGRPGSAAENWEPWERLVVLYVHDFIYRFVCTAAGFLALFVAKLALDGMSMEAPSSGGLVFVAGAFLIGVVGQLHYVILLGKLPGVKE